MITESSIHQQLIIYHTIRDRVNTDKLKASRTKQLTIPLHQALSTSTPSSNHIYQPNTTRQQLNMLFRSSNPHPRRRSSALSTLSTSSATSTNSDLSAEVLEATLPMAPREDNFNMSEKDRRASLLARCRKAVEPWKSAKPLSQR